MIFLRPYWLVLLIVPFLFIWIRRKGETQNPWKSYISATFMPYLSVLRQTAGSRIRMNWLLATIWTLMVLALSGPAIDKLPTPVAENIPTTVLVVDLNTLNPEKTTLLHVKLYHLINELQDNQIGLVLYDTKGYTALPITRDKEILNMLVPSLAPTVMPSVGNDASKGFQKAMELLKNTGQKTGRILFITGGTPDIQSALPLLENTPYNIGVLGIGDEKTGTPIMTKFGTFLRDEKGDIILSKPDATVLSRLGVYRHTTPTGVEIAELVNETKPMDLPLLQNVALPLSETEITADIWRDLGIYLTIALLPFIAYLFRKGLFFSFILFCLLTTQSAYAGLWLRADQESYRTIEAGNAAYHQQAYQQALKLYENDTTTEALYNRANALAQLGKYQEAIETYTTLLEKDPTHADGAYNKAYLEEQLKKQQEKQQQQQQEQKQQESEQKPEEQKEQKPEEEPQEQEQPETKEQQEPESKPEQQEKQEQEQEKPEQEKQEEQQPEEQEQEQQPEEQQEDTPQESETETPNEQEDESEEKENPEQTSESEQAEQQQEQDAQQETADETNNAWSSIPTNNNTGSDTNNLGNKKTNAKTQPNKPRGTVGPQENPLSDQTDTPPFKQQKLSPTTESNNANPTDDKANTAQNIQNQSITKTQNDSKPQSDSRYAVEIPLSSDMIDQETQQIINRIKKDPARILKYRLHRQYRENP